MSSARPAVALLPGVSGRWDEQTQSWWQGRPWPCALFLLSIVFQFVPLCVSVRSILPWVRDRTTAGGFFLTICNMAPSQGRLCPLLAPTDQEACVAEVVPWESPSSRSRAEREEGCRGTGEEGCGEHSGLSEQSLKEEGERGSAGQSQGQEEGHEGSGHFPLMWQHLPRTHRNRNLYGEGWA